MDIEQIKLGLYVNLAITFIWGLLNTNLYYKCLPRQRLIIRLGLYAPPLRRVRRRYGEPSRRSLGSKGQSTWEINITRLAQITKADEVVVIPGKVLGTGSLGHKLTFALFHVRRSCQKIIESGGKVVTFDDLIKLYPDGKGVRIIG